MATRIFAAYTGLLTAVKAALPDLVAVGAVYDGPQPAFPTSKDIVLVGVQNPLTDGMKLAVDSGAQDWAAVWSTTPRKRDETFVIYSTLVAWTGSNDLPGCRARADVNLSAIETQLRADTTLGGALTNGGTTGPGWCGMSVVSLEQVADPKGVAIHALFAVDCHARV